MHVSDDIERTVFVFQIVPERLAFDLDSVDLFRRRENSNVTKAFTPEIAQGLPQSLALIADDVRSEIAVRAPWFRS